MKSRRLIDKPRKNIKYREVTIRVKKYVVKALNKEIGTKVDREIRVISVNKISDMSFKL